ncbi:MAG: TIGR00730 family Rossman fold protein, partial [Alcaligenes sp.]
VPPAPIVLIGTEFWSGLIGWIREQLLTLGLIAPKDLDLLVVTDDLDEVMTYINKCCVLPRAEPALPQ